MFEVILNVGLLMAVIALYIVPFIMAVAFLAVVYMFIKSK